MKPTFWLVLLMILVTSCDRFNKCGCGEPPDYEIWVKQALYPAIINEPILIEFDGNGSWDLKFSIEQAVTNADEVVFKVESLGTTRLLLDSGLLRPLNEGELIGQDSLYVNSRFTWSLEDRVLLEKDARSAKGDWSITKAGYIGVSMDDQFYGWVWIEIFTGYPKIEIGYYAYQTRGLAIEAGDKGEMEELITD